MTWIWIGFIIFVLLMLALDLGVFHRRAREVSVKEALIWTGVWVTVALAFAVFVYFLYEYHWLGAGQGQKELGGQEAALLFLTGYVIEESLSIDNMFVIAMIFSYFAVPVIYQHRVLFWGIIGAFAMRAAMIAGGVVLVQRFHWVLYIFGAFLIFSATRMLTARHEPDPRNNPILRGVQRLLPVVEGYHDERFIVRTAGKLALTPLALALVAVESADLVFALDSIPAIFAITDVPFLIFTSNIFAVMGLRSLYFVLAGIMHKFRYLKISVAMLLVLVGMKMLLKDVLHAVPGQTYWMIGAIVLILAGGIGASLIHAARRGSKSTGER